MMLISSASCFLDSTLCVSSPACGDHAILYLPSAMLLASFSYLFLTPPMMLLVRVFESGSKKLTHMRHRLPACAHR